MPKRNNEPDFKKVRQKVGTKKVNPRETNVNIRTKRIRIQEQSIMREEEDMVNYRNKSLNDLVSQFTHYNAGVRKEAVLGLRDLFAQNEILYTTSLSVLVTKTIPLLLDTDVGVRQALVTVYGSLLVNVNQGQLLPFSGLICVFVNNGLTSINPAIRRSSLLMVQTLLKIDPSVFRDSTVKLLSSIVKLTVDAKASTVSNRGVLSSNRTQMKANSNEQRPVSELALETLHQFFSTCFVGSSVYEEIDNWSGFQKHRAESVVVLKESCVSIPLRTTIYPLSQFFSSSTPASESTLVSTMQTLMKMLFMAVSELIPQEGDESSSRSSQFSLSNRESKIRSKSMRERDLRRFLLLAELTANAFTVLRHQQVSTLTEKKNKDWCALLLDFYPLRLPDSHRNEAASQVLLHHVNALTALLLLLIGGNTEYMMHELNQRVVFASSNDAVYKTIVIKVEGCYQLLQLGVDSEKVMDFVNAIWNALLENGSASYSLPLIQFYSYLIEHQPSLSYAQCVHSLLKCLIACPYDENENSRSHALWKWGLKLLLNLFKSAPPRDDSLPSRFESLLVPSNENPSVFNRLPLESQSSLLAILTLSNAITPRIIDAIPQVKECSDPK